MHRMFFKIGFFALLSVHLPILAGDLDGDNPGDFQSATEYRVATEQSYIHVYTGVAGAAKSVSHKHLVSLGNFAGKVVLDGDNSYAELQLRPADFLVDDDQARSQAVDEEYQAPVSGWIKSGTKRNMNGRKLLEADLYKTIEVRIQLDELTDAPTFLVSLKLKNRMYEINAPGQLDIAKQQLRARGDFRLSHKDLGLKPFKAAGGLARVADELRFVFDIIASKQETDAIE